MKLVIKVGNGYLTRSFRDTRFMITTSEKRAHTFQPYKIITVKKIADRLGGKVLKRSYKYEELK